MIRIIINNIKYKATNNICIESVLSKRFMCIVYKAFIFSCRYRYIMNKLISFIARKFYRTIIFA